MTSYNNNNSSESKIENKFYPLQMEEHLRACKELTSAQRDICYYLKTLDPDGKGLDFSVKGLSEQLGLSRQTVSRALKVLDTLGWLELEKIYGTKVSIKSKFKND